MSRRKHEFDPCVGNSNLWGGYSNPLQYSCLEDSMDRGAWWATAHGVTKTWGHTHLNMHAAAASCRLQILSLVMPSWLMSLQKTFSVSVTVLSISRIWFSYNVYLSAEISYLIMHALCFIYFKFQVWQFQYHVLRIWFYKLSSLKSALFFLASFYAS